jgi:hypothetical protein
LSTALLYFKNWSIPEKMNHLRQYFSRVKETEVFKKVDYGEEMIIKGWRKKVESA